jgi:two-component system LytT family response regulator
MIKAVIIDDEPEIRELNQALLKENFPAIELVGQADSVKSGIELIKKTQPDLVLLDIELKNGSGFEILQKLRPFKFKTIFVTGFNDYAIKAIKFSAIDYIVKPVNEVEFRQAVQSALDLIESELSTEMQSNNFLDDFKKENQLKKIVLRTSEALHIVDVLDIMYCRSDNSYTTFYLSSNEKIVVSKSLREYDDLLKGYSFIRPHQSYLVNLNHVKKVDKSDGGFIIMKNAAEIPVSIRQKKHLINMLENL